MPTKEPNCKNCGNDTCPCFGRDIIGCFEELAEAPENQTPQGQAGLPGYVHKGWTIEYMPKPGKPGIVDWDATHPDEEVMLNGKSINNLMDQIDAL